MKEAPDPELRKDFAYALSSFGDRAAEAAPWIAEDLESDKPLRAESAAKALGSIGPPAKPFVPEILPLLEDLDEPGEVLAAIQALSRIGAEKERAVRAALALVKGDNKYYGAWGAAALRDLEPDSRAVLDDLREVLKSLGGGSSEEDEFARSFRESLSRTIADLGEGKTAEE
jgi:hypothetical protein